MTHRGARAGNGGRGMHWIRDTTRGRIYARDGHRCVYCSAPRECLDHVRPRSLGGTNAPRNLVTACFDCNVKRGAASVRAVFGADVARAVRNAARRVLPPRGVPF